MIVITEPVGPEPGAKADQIARIIAGLVPLAYLKSVDPDAHDGYGHIELTDLLEEAQRFPSIGAVFECWKTRSTKRPLRDDGRPNRPLTAFSITPRELKDGAPPHV